MEESSIRFTQIQNWVLDVFNVVGIVNPPSHLVQYYTEQLFFQQIQPEKVKQEVMEMISGKANVQSGIPKLSSPLVEQQPQTQAQLSAIPFDERKSQEEEKKRLYEQIGESSSSSTNGSRSQSESYKEYVDQLFVKYVGRCGDPGSTNFLVNSLMNKSYTIQQAEYFVRFSKEAKAYQKNKKLQQEKERNDRVWEYVKELFRVFLKKKDPSTEEMSVHVNAILQGKQTLQETEDEFRLMSLAVPSSINSHNTFPS